MRPRRTSRFHFCIIDHSPEIVPSPTMFLQESAPKLIARSSTFEELFGLSINSLTDSPPAKCRYSLFTFTGAPVSHVREGASRPPSGLWPTFLGVEKLVAHHPRWHIGTKEYRRRRDTARGGRLQDNWKMLFIYWEILSMEYLLVMHSCHSLSNSSYLTAPYCLLLRISQHVYGICSVWRNSMRKGTTGAENKLERKPSCKLWSMRSGQFPSPQMYKELK